MAKHILPTVRITSTLVALLFFTMEPCGKWKKKRFVQQELYNTRLSVTATFYLIYELKYYMFRTAKKKKCSN